MYNFRTEPPGVLTSSLLVVGKYPGGSFHFLEFLVKIEVKGHKVYLNAMSQIVVESPTGAQQLPTTYKSSSIDTPETAAVRKEFYNKKPSVCEVAQFIEKWEPKREPVVVKGYKITIEERGQKCILVTSPDGDQCNPVFLQRRVAPGQDSALQAAIRKAFYGKPETWETVDAIAKFIEKFKSEIVVGDYKVYEWTTTFAVDGPAETGTLPARFSAPGRCPVINKLRAMNLPDATPVAKVAELIREILEGEKVTAADGKTYTIKDGKFVGPTHYDLQQFCGTPVTREKVLDWRPMRDESFCFSGYSNSRGSMIPFTTGWLVLKNGVVTFFTDKDAARRSL